MERKNCSSGSNNNAPLRWSRNTKRNVSFALSFYRNCKQPKISSTVFPSNSAITETELGLLSIWKQCAGLWKLVIFSARILFLETGTTT